ncbi:MAG: ABC transporter permease [Anaerolineales bacterium]|uniref:ABC transporter permease n=1 Tax=Candidatus Villigracilis affinis TaxID=3140682 RepID=UPI001D2FABBD|nr:ABC transporter permease [Anaerolineales bacterium]MBK9602849.1 ABC transporter permease [Anaerolineales bacterium]MBL0346019.1 ABC transporter permease [Anaerolineales bacterium]
MMQILKMAFRDLGRNRRRSFFSALAVGGGLALLILMSSVVAGEMGSAIESAINLQTGHIQIRAATYDENKSSLKWEDLVSNPDEVANKIAALDQVETATPRLYASGFLSSGTQSAGARITGIDPLSPASDPYREGVISGDYLNPDDRDALLIGKPMADKLNLEVGDSVSLSLNTADGNVQDQTFIVKGIYTTHTYSFDSATVFLPLAKAQAMTRTENHASTIFVLLKDTTLTDSVVPALSVSSNLEIKTWKDLNVLFVEYETFAQSYIAIFYMIILAISASVIINTLIMSVYERTREIGVLSAIGMRGGRIMMLFLAESSMLAVGGVMMGLIIGVLATLYFNINGFYIGDMGLSGMTIADTIYAKLTMENLVNLTIMTFVVTLLAGLYPAVMASRMQPVEALRAEK